MKVHKQVLEWPGASPFWTHTPIGSLSVQDELKEQTTSLHEAARYGRYELLSMLLHHCRGRGLLPGACLVPDGFGEKEFDVGGVCCCCCCYLLLMMFMMMMIMMCSCWRFRAYLCAWLIVWLGVHLGCYSIALVGVIAARNLCSQTYCNTFSANTAAIRSSSGAPSSLSTTKLEEKRITLHAPHGHELQHHFASVFFMPFYVRNQQKPPRTRRVALTAFIFSCIFHLAYYRIFQNGSHPPLHAGGGVER